MTDCQLCDQPHPERPLTECITSIKTQNNEHRILSDAWRKRHDAQKARADDLQRRLDTIKLQL